MKHTAALTYLILCLFAFIKLQFLFACVASLFLGIGLYLLKGSIDHYLLVRRYKIIKEDIIVASRHPKTNDEIDLGRYNKYIVWTDYRKVIKEVERQKELLTKAGNTFFVDESLSKNQRITVEPEIFRSGENIIEEWEDYGERLLDIVKAKLSARHKMFHNQKNAYYNKYFNNQIGVEWEP